MALGGLAAGVAGRSWAQPRRFENTTLNILTRASPAFDATIAAGPAFTEATGIKLQYTRISPSDNYSKLMLDLSSGTNAYDVAVFVYQWKQDVAPYLADLSSLNRDVAGSADLGLEDYAPNLLDVYGKSDGKLVGLPIVGDVSFLVWNKDLYRAAGLDPERGAASWDEVAAHGKAATREGGYGYALPAGKTPQCYVTWTVLYHAMGGRYTKADGQLDLGGPAGVKAMETMVKGLQPIAPPGNLTWDYNEVVGSFSGGKSAQAIMWPGGFATLSDPAKSAVAGKFGIVQPPGGALLGGTSIGVNAKARNPEAARLYLAWLTSRDVVKRTALGGTPPARLSVLADPELAARYPYWPAVRTAMLGETFGYIPVKEAEQVLLLAADEANAACAGTKPPEQAAADLQTKATTFLRRRGHLK
jgi:multiple sugar transport system substrate-binding protein